MIVPFVNFSLQQHYMYSTTNIKQTNQSHKPAWITGLFFVTVMCHEAGKCIIQLNVGISRLLVELRGMLCVKSWHE